MHIEVTRHVIEQIEAEARAAHPRECCGILLGEGNRIDRALSTMNVHAVPETHFEIDPQALVDAHRAAREGGPQVLGYYHSHPQGEPLPSHTDQQMAAGDGQIWAIFGQQALRLWRDDPPEFAEVSYCIVDG